MGFKAYHEDDNGKAKWIVTGGLCAAFIIAVAAGLGSALSGSNSGGQNVAETIVSSGVLSDGSASDSGAGHVSYYGQTDANYSFAVYSDTDRSLRFYGVSDESAIPSAGDTYDGREVTEIDSTIEVLDGISEDSRAKVVTIKVEDPIAFPATDMSYYFATGKTSDTGNGGFSTELREIDLDWMDTYLVESMQGLFYVSDDLSGELQARTISLDNFDEAGATDLSWMFYNETTLTSLDVSKFVTTSVTTTQGMFKNCTSLASLDVSGFDVHNVVDMSRMFENCSSLTDLNILSWDVRNVTDTSSMFENCLALTRLHCEGLNGKSLAKCRAMFRNCRSLQTIYADDSWVMDNVTDSQYMFEGCDSLAGDGAAYSASGVSDGSMATFSGYLTQSTL